MALRKILTGMLVLVMASSAWGSGVPLGSVVSSSDATVRNSKLVPGSTVFAGDIVAVAEHGATRIAISGGAQAEVLGNSSVRLTKDGGKVQMTVDRGLASFHTSGGAPMSAFVADARVRAAGGAETSAIIHSLSETHALIAAEKGALLITANDGKVYTVKEGEAAELSAVPESQQNGGAAPAGKAPPSLSISNKKVVYWTVGIVGGGVAVTAYLLARKETKRSTTELGNEISPHTLN